MNIKKWITAAVTCSALALGVCDGQDRSSSAANPYEIYHIDMNAESAPFESQTSEDSVEGFDVDLMNTMAETGNFKAGFEHQPRESLFPSLDSGDIDIVIPDVTITDERKQSMDFSDPYFEVTQVVLVPKGKKAVSSDDLGNMAKAGVVTGQTGGFSASRLLGSDNPKISRFETVPPIIRGLENGGLDSVVNDGAVIANYVKDNPTKGLDFIALPDSSIENHGIVVRKGDRAAVKTLSDALKKVRKSDECSKIHAKYFAKKEAKAGKIERTRQSGLITDIALEAV